MALPVSIISQPEIDIAHNEIHIGTFFGIHKINTNITIANPKKFLFISSSETPVPADTTKTHLILLVSCDLGVKIEFFENTQTSSNGTILNFINQNRNSAITADDSAFEDPIVISEGTKIYEELIGSTTTGGTGGLTNRNEDELILKVGTKYLLKITPLIDGVNITTHFKLYDDRPNLP